MLPSSTVDVMEGWTHSEHGYREAEKAYASQNLWYPF